MEEILLLLPPEWAALCAEWAPTLLALFLAVIGFVHAVLPIARRLEAWAIASASTRDDGPMRTLVIALERIAGAGTWLLSRVGPRIGEGNPRPKSDPGGMEKLPPVRDRSVARDLGGPPPSGGALALALVVAASALSAATGCGATPFEIGVDVAEVTEQSAEETRRMVRAYRTDVMRTAARAVFESGGSREDAIAAAEARGAELNPLVEAQRLYAIASHHGFVDALDLAGGDIGADGVRQAARGVLDAYRHLRRLGASLGVAELAALPATPGWLDALLPPQMLASDGAQEGSGR